LIGPLPGRLQPLQLLRRLDQVLFQFPVRVGVGGQCQRPAGIDDLEGVKVMPPHSLFLI